MWPVTQRPVTLRSAPHRRYLPVTLPDPDPRTAGLYPGEPETCRRNVAQFLAILAHLGLYLAVFKIFRIEGRAFQILVATALVALPIHYLLHYRWKKLFLVAATIAGMVCVFDWATTSYVLALSALLIGVCYLPIAWGLRAAILGGTALAMALMRPETVSTVVPEIVWPILATMFMFRMIVYLYELKHAKAPEPVVDTLSYFFLLPNFCFLHFPVVDYRTMQRGYFARDIHQVQRAGLKMMFRGMTHLLLYRLVDHEWRLSPDDVHNTASLVQYLVCNYMLYLKVSGQFHMACGMLHLFGFQLPETHHHYLLATGFTDYWRRINIYWKDFMVRIVFNPVVFRMKRWPQSVALAVATTVVFVVTWALHAYQWYWLQGSWKFTTPDALFWGILGILVLVNVQLDARRTRSRAARQGNETPRAFAVRGAKILGTFTTIALLWSLWSSPSVGAWVGLMRRGLGI